MQIPLAGERCVVQFSVWRKRSGSYLRFSLLLLNSLIMSDRKTLRTSMLSGDGGEFFNREAITFRISTNINRNKPILLRDWKHRQPESSAFFIY